MALYYVFYSKTKKLGRPFQKHRSLCGALAGARGQEARVYRHVDGIPNPFWLWPVKNGKVDRSKIYKGIPDKRLDRLKPQGVFG